MAEKLYMKAKAVFLTIRALEPKSVKVMMKLVQAKLQLRDKSALQELDSVLAIEPGHREALRIRDELKRRLPQK